MPNINIDVGDEVKAQDLRVRNPDGTPSNFLDLGKVVLVYTSTNNQITCITTTSGFRLTFDNNSNLDPCPNNI